MDDENIVSAETVTASEDVTAPSETVAASPEVAQTETTAEVPATDAPVAETTTEVPTEANPTADADAATPDSTSVPTASGETAGTEESQETTTAESDDDDDDSEISEDDFSKLSPEAQRKETNKARRQAQRRRETIKSLEEQLAAGTASPFGDVPEEFSGAWNDLTQKFLANPEDPEVKAVFAGLAGVDTPALDENALFDKVRDYFATQEAEAARNIDVAQKTAAFQTKAAELGYNADATPESDPEAFVRNRAFWAVIAEQSQAGSEIDLDAANAKVQAYEESVFNRKLEELKAANTGTPVVHGAGTAGGEPAPKTGRDSYKGLSPKQIVEKAKQDSKRLAEEQQSGPLS